MNKNQSTVITNGNLHLRRLGLDQARLLILLGEIEETLKDSPQKLNSFSLSYNDTLEDIGVSKLVKFLPSDLKDLGLVGCNIGDEGAEKLMSWIESTTDLEMLCIENNHFSNEMNTKIQEISRAKGFTLFS